MKILVLSSRYPPDLSPGAFRTAGLVRALLERPGADVSVEVLTTLPAADTVAADAIPEAESDGRLTVRRVPLPPGGAGSADRPRALLAWAAGVRRLARSTSFDMVHATSSGLLTAVLASSIARRRRVPLHLDIRGPFAARIGDVLPRGVGIVAAPVLAGAERRAIRGAAGVSLASHGLEARFRAWYPGVPVSVFTHGVDAEFVAAAPAGPGPPVGDRRPVRVTYAGTVGDGQRLDAIVPALAAALGDEAGFTVIGAGSRRGHLRRALARAGCTNVALHAPLPRPELLRAYADADVLFLHVDDGDALARTLPAKIFEYAASGKPVWAGTRGEAAAFLREEVTNSAVFDPGDAAAAVAALRSLDLRTVPRPGFVERYARDAISRRMAEAVVAAGASGRAGR